MAKLLYIESSPRKKRSASIAVSNDFLEEYRKTHPNDEVIVLDLWKKNLPPFDGDIIDSKYAILHGESFFPAQKKAWEAVESIIAEFKNVDKYVISLPMWNFGIPYRLKHYIDILVQPGYTFSFSPQTGYKGLVTGKKMLLIYARGGAYGAETGSNNFDIQKPYMETILGFIGFKDFQSIVIEPTLGVSPDEKDKLIKQAQKQASATAKGF